MNRHLFLTGRDGCGKTALLREELGAAAAYAGGFLTLPTLEADGRLTKCSLYPAAALAGADAYEGETFLSLGGTPPTHDNEVFRGTGVRLLNESPYYPFTILDELGGFEILIPQFRAALTEVLNNDRPLIGVFKDRRAADAQRVQLGLSDRFTMITDNMRRVLAADADTLVVTVHGRNDFLARRAVRQWIKEYIARGF